MIPGSIGADAIFEDRRAAMTGLAYRMLGSRAEAEDVVQDAAAGGDHGEAGADQRPAWPGAGG